MTGGRFSWIDLCITITLLEVSQGFKPEQIVRRGPGSDPQCMSPLISALDEFPDSAFSASSVLWNKTDFQPYQARLIEVYGSREHTSGYAWCPAAPVGEMLQDWIQADFTELVMIKSIFTAGRGDGNVKEFMPSFVLRYQRQDGGTWYEHVKRDGTRVLLANSDPRNLARATLDTMVIAKRVRLYPYSRSANQNVCLRFALYGCKFPDGVVSYSMPQGGLGLARTSYHPTYRDDVLDSSVVRQLKDLSYDGQMVGTTYQQLTDGLGQLMDNVAFLGNLTRESDVYPTQPGFHFVGWHQAEHSEVQILFEFDTARLFTWLRLFTFDSIPLRVRLFSRATVSFSLDGIRFVDSLEFTTGRVYLFDSRSSVLSRSQRSPIRSFSESKRTRLTDSNQPDIRIYSVPEYAGGMVVEMDLTKRIARYIRLTIVPTDNWIVLSEIQFNSTMATPPKLPAYSLEASKNTTPLLPRLLKNKPVDIPTNIGDQPAVAPPVQGFMGAPDRDTADINNKPRHKSGPSASAKQTGNSPADPTKFLNDFVTSNEKFVTILPVIITVAIILFLLPTVLLVWLCKRRQRKGTRLLCLNKNGVVDGGRGALHSHNRLGTGDLFTLGPNPTLSTQEAAKLLSPYQQVATKSHTDGTFAPLGSFCMSNGNNHPGLFLRIGDGNMISSTTAGNMVQPIQYPSSQQPPGTGVLVAYSPNSSDSCTDPHVPGPIISTMAQTIALNNFTQASVEPSLYSQTDANCMSPEYASASIFSFTPPPSEPPTSNPSLPCSEAAQAATVRQTIPTYTVSFAHPCTGSNNEYAGPDSMPLDMATLRVQSRHAPSTHFQTNVNSRAPGLLLLPQHSFGCVSSDDPQGLYHSISSNPYVFPPEYGRPCNLHAPDQQVSGQHHMNQPTNWFSTQVTMGSEATSGWMPSTMKRQSLIPYDSAPRQNIWPPELHNVATTNVCLLPNPMHLTGFPLSVASEIPAPTRNGPQLPPQHYIPTHLVFPILSPPQSSKPTIETEPDSVTRQNDFNFRRGSPVGAAKGSVLYPVPSHESAVRDGNGSGRLSIYSVCT